MRNINTNNNIVKSLIKYALLIIINTIVILFILNFFYKPINNDNSITSKMTTNLLNQKSQASIDAVEKSKNSVVGVVNLQKQSSDLNSLFENFLNPGSNSSSSQGKLEDTGTGSGVVYKVENNKAYIITNNHVVSQGDAIEVVLSDGSRTSAEVLGTDETQDLAVITIKNNKLVKAATLGDSENLSLGESVIAIGNPISLEDYYGSVTTGVISGKSRKIQTESGIELSVIQTDAAINGGNSGGALVNLKGEVVGINTAKLNQSLAEGIAFSIPINSVQNVLNSLEKGQNAKKAELGVKGLDLSEITINQKSNELKLPDNINSGFVILEVSQGSAASKANLKDMDVIVKLDGKDIQTSQDIADVLNSKKTNDKIQIEFYRSGNLVKQYITL